MTRRQKPLRIVITAGSTREPIDPVRFVSNYSTGYMGACLAMEACSRSHHVVVILGPSTEPFPRGVQVVSVEDARQMDRALRRRARRADVVMMAAAVSDFRPVRVATSKLRRRSRLALVLQSTPDLVARLPRLRKRQVIAGFAIETGRVLPRARRKLREKHLDLLLAQQISRRGEPFGRRPVRAWLLEAGGTITALGRCSKAQVARVLLDKIETLWYGRTMCASAC